MNAQQTQVTVQQMQHVTTYLEDLNVYAMWDIVAMERRVMVMFKLFLSQNCVLNLVLSGLLAIV